MVKRWHTPPPPMIDYPDAEDVDGWRRLGRLLSAGETPGPLIEIWRRGDLEPEARAINSRSSARAHIGTSAHWLEQGIAR
jgi:hypothetical protein